MNKILLLSIIMLFSFPTVLGSNYSFNEIENHNFKINLLDDYDPLVDISVTVEIEKIRSFDKKDAQIPSIEKIDDFGDPDIRLFPEQLPQVSTHV